MAARFSELDLDRWVESGLISSEQRTAILGELRERPPQFRLSVADLLYYGGGLLVLLAYSVFLGFQWESLNETGRVIISAISFVLFAAASTVMLRYERLRLPGELLQVVAVAVVPLLTFAVLDAAGLWPDDPGFRASTGELEEHQDELALGRMAMAAVTFLAAVAAFRLSRSPYVLVGGIVALTWLAMDVTFLLQPDRTNFELLAPQLVAVGVMGAFTLAAGVLVEGRFERDYSLWLYIAGLAGLAFGFGIQALASDTEGWAILFLVVSLAVLTLSVPLQQRLFAVAGLAGVFAYLARLVFDVFETAGAALALVVLGLLVLAAGALYQRYSDRLFGHPSDA